MTEKEKEIIEKFAKIEVICKRKSKEYQGVQSSNVYSNNIVTYKDYLAAIEKIVANIDNKNLTELLSVIKKSYSKCGISKLKFKNSNNSLDEKELEIIDFYNKMITKYETQMISTRAASNLLGIEESKIVEACLTGQLLNTKISSMIWLVHLPECMDHWKDTIK